MTEYGHFTSQPATSLLSQDVQERKEALKKLLDEIFRRRAENKKRFYAKMAEQAKTKDQYINPDQGDRVE